MRLAIVVIVMGRVIWTQQSETLCIKVVTYQIIQFLGQLKNSTEDKHLAIVNVGSVAASCIWFVLSVWNHNFFPFRSCTIELPQVVQFVIIVVLPSEDVELSFIENR